MAGGKATYCGLITKARAMEGKLLPMSFFEELLELGSTEEIVAYVSQKTEYHEALHKSGILHRQQAEPALRESLYQDYQRLYQFADPIQRSAMELLFLQYQADAIKRCLLYLGRDRPVFTPFEIQFFSEKRGLDLQELIDAQTKENFVEVLHDTCYYKRLHRLLEEDHFRYYEAASVIDSMRYEESERRIHHLDKRNRTVLLELIGTECDWMNLQWIMRMVVYYHMKPADIFAATIPVYYKLRREQILAMVEAEDAKQLQVEILKSFYGKNIRGTPEWNTSLTDPAWQRELYHAVALKAPFSVAPVYRYLFEKEKEIKRLTTAIEGIHYHMDPVVLKSLVMDRDGGNYSG